MRSLDLVGTRRWFFAFSGALAVAALVLLAIPPTLRPGIEFTAGTTTLVRFERPVAQSALRDAYAGLDHPEARIQSTGEREYLIRTSELRVPDSALIEVNPAATAGSAPPPAELGALRLGAAGEGGEVPLRVFRFGEACDFGEEIARFPAGTEAVVYAEIRDCPAPADGEDPANGEDATDTEDPATSEDPANGEDPADAEDATTAEDPANGEDGEADLPPIVAYRVQAGGADGTTGFVAPADTHGFRAAGEDASDGEDAAGADGSGAEPAPDLGERGVIERALEERFGPFEVLEFASVSAVVSRQAVRNATVAVVVAALFIMGYIVFAFSGVPRPLRYASAAIVALAHDVILVLGAFSLFGKVFGTEINLMFVTGLLTIIGFSVHDTIVIFDRVRENVRLAPAARFADNVNAALVQTLGRSINTSVTLVFTILALLWLGGPTIRAFLVVLLVGVVAGAYSSIGIAAQVLVAWEEGDASRLLGRFRRRPPAEEPAGG